MDAASGGRNTSEALQETAAPAPDPDNPFAELFLVLAPPSLLSNFSSLWLCPPLSPLTLAFTTHTQAHTYVNTYAYITHTRARKIRSHQHQLQQQEAELQQPTRGRLQVHRLSDTQNMMKTL